MSDEKKVKVYRDEEKKYADQTIERSVVDNVQVRTYTLNDENDSLFRILSEEQISRKVHKYEEEEFEKMMKDYKERERIMNAQVAAELGEDGFDNTAIPAEGAASKVEIDPDKIQEAFSKLTKDDRILCIGDSLVYGYEMEGALTWIGILRRECEINLLNVGINSDTTDNMIDRFYTHVVNNQAKAVLILGGGNDIFGNTPLTYVTNNYALLCQMALNFGIVPIVATPTEPDHKRVPKEWKAFVDYDQACNDIKTYRDWLIEFAHANKMPLVDFGGEMKSRLRAGYSRFFLDGAHPNPAGHRMMASIAKDAFIEMGLLKKEEKPEDHRFDL